MRIDKKTYKPTGPIGQQFFKEVPMVDKEGKVIPQNPPLTNSFWKKPKTTSGIIIKENAKRFNK